MRREHAQRRLVEAEHDLAQARADAEAVQARLNERARQAFMSFGPGASAAYLLEADSFADLMDRTVMLDSVQRADASLGAEFAVEAARMAAQQAALEQAMNLFSITTNRHTFALFTEAGDELTELNESLKAAGVEPSATLLLGPSRVRGGGC